MEILSLGRLMKMKPDFIMTVGIPGCGKSRWVNEYCKNHDVEIVSTDGIRKELTGTVNTMKELGREEDVWNRAMNRVANYLTEGKNVILDATNCRSRERIFFIKHLPDCNLKAKVIECDIKTAFGRISKDMQNRKERSNVPYDVVCLMHERFVNDRGNLTKEGFEVI